MSFGQKRAGLFSQSTGGSLTVSVAPVVNPDLSIEVVTIPVIVSETLLVDILFIGLPSDLLESDLSPVGQNRAGLFSQSIGSSSTVCVPLGTSPELV